MKVAIIFDGTRLGTMDVPWMSPELFKTVAGERETEVEGYKSEWKKVGNEYRIYYTKR